MFAVYVKPRHEKNVAVAFKYKGFEAFLPTYTECHGYKKFQLPLFPGYIFCRSELSKTSPLVTTPGALSIVGNGRQPISERGNYSSACNRIRVDALPLALSSDWAGVLYRIRPTAGVRRVLVDASDQRWLVVQFTFFSALWLQSWRNIIESFVHSSVVG